ncbi:MAG: hypothetical protein AMXMBFR64_56780 [Myxococcales bacterium]
MQHFAPASVEHIHVTPRSFEFLAETVWLVKAVDGATQKPVSVCFGDDGAVMDDCGAAFSQQEAALRWSLHGSLDPQLYDLAQETDEVTPIPVVIWLRTHEPSPPKEALLVDPDPALTHAKAIEDEQQAAVKGLAGSWSQVTTASFQHEPGTPAVYADLTRDELLALSDAPAIAQIYWQEPNTPGSTSYVDTVQASGTGYTGAAEKICVVEQRQPNTPNDLVIAGTYCGGGNKDNHARVVAGVIRDNLAPYGVATGASVYMSTWSGCDSDARWAFSWCHNTQSAHIWNFSHNCSTADERLFDYYAKSSSAYPLISVLSGNHDSTPLVNCGTACGGSRAEIWCPTFNTLVVGGANDCGDSNRTNDVIMCRASDLNPPDARELPHVVAPGQGIDADGLTGYWGTSFAAPQVAAAAAQIHERNTDLRVWPEAVRSLIMAGATETVDGGPLDLSDGVDDRDGAGLISVHRSVTMAHPTYRQDGGNTPSTQGYDYGSMDQYNDPAGSFYNEVWSARTTSTGMRLRVVLSWDATTTCTGNPPVDCTSPALDADLDLWVYRVSDGAVVATSRTVPNSYEFVEFDAARNETYRIMVDVYHWNSSSTWFGIAWLMWPFSTN